MIKKSNLNSFRENEEAFSLYQLLKSNIYYNSDKVTFRLIGIFCFWRNWKTLPSLKNRTFAWLQSQTVQILPANRITSWLQRSRQQSQKNIQKRFLKYPSSTTGISETMPTFRRTSAAGLSGQRGRVLWNWWKHRSHYSGYFSAVSKGNGLWLHSKIAEAKGISNC